VLFPAAEGTPSEPVSARTAPAVEPFGAALTVLVVDDDETVRRAVPLMLNRFGVKAVTAEDGRQALEVFSENMDTIDCVLLDLTMPEMDGVECFRELRELKHDVKVVLSSGYNEQDATQRFAGKGLAGFIQKPYVAEDLLNRLRAILGA
jgi:CheY-like chemotaxis protein